MAVLDGLARLGTRKSRREAETIARDREAARKKEADAERHRLRNSRSVKDTEEALAHATQFDSLKTGSELAQAISWASQPKDEQPSEPPDEFSSPVDLETYEPPAGPPQPEPVLKVQRVRDPRSR